jgi:hypothetical protein
MYMDYYIVSSFCFVMYSGGLSGLAKHIFIRNLTFDYDF